MAQRSHTHTLTHTHTHTIHLAPVNGGTSTGSDSTYGWFRHTPKDLSPDSFSRVNVHKYISPTLEGSFRPSSMG